MNFIIYCFAILLYILLMSAVSFAVFKFAFWIFDALGIENPVIVAVNTIKDAVSVLFVEEN